MAGRCPVCQDDMASCPCGWVKEEGPGSRWTMTMDAYAAACQAHGGSRGTSPARPPAPGSRERARKRGRAAQADGAGHRRAPGSGKPVPPGAPPAPFGLPGDLRAWARCANWLCARILDGEWGPGDRLPTMLETAIETETSTGTADKAYRKLRGAGLIYLDDDKRYRVTGCAREIAAEMAGQE